MRHIPPIRDATIDDIPAMLVMAEKFIEKAWAHVGVPFDESTCAGLLSRLIDSETGILLIGDRCMFGGIVYPWHFNNNYLTAQELFWWSESRSGLLLLKEAEARAREMGAKTFNMACMDHMGSATLAQFYQRRGYTPNEHIFIRELDQWSA